MDIENKYTNNDFGDALIGLMKDKRLSYRQLSIKAKVSFQFLQQIATKKVLPPKDEFVKKIGKALNVEPSYFYEYRLRRLIDYCRADKDLLESCLNLAEKQFQKKISSRSAKTGTARAKGAGKARRKEATAG